MTIKPGESTKDIEQNLYKHKNATLRADIFQADASSDQVYQLTNQPIHCTVLTFLKFNWKDRHFEYSKQKS